MSESDATEALVGFSLADPAAQTLALDPEILGDLGDRIQAPSGRRR